MKAGFLNCSLNKTYWCWFLNQFEWKLFQRWVSLIMIIPIQGVYLTFKHGMFLVGGSCNFPILCATFFFTDMETSPLPMKGCKFWTMLGTYEQWGFFNVPHLLWHESSVYNGHLWGLVTLTPIAELVTVPCHYLFSLRSVAAGIRTPNLPLAGKTL